MKYKNVPLLIIICMDTCEGMKVNREQVMAAVVLIRQVKWVDRIITLVIREQSTFSFMPIALRKEKGGEEN